MKNKTSRKKGVQKSPKGLRIKFQAPSLPKFKFNLSKDNLSCFIGSSRPCSRFCRKNSRSLYESTFTEPLIKGNSRRKAVDQKQEKEERKFEGSPDLLRQLPNTIISRIEKRGIKCPWNDGEEPTQTEDPGHELDSQSIWSAFQNSQVKSYTSTNLSHQQTFSYFQYETTNSFSQKRKDQTLVFTIQPQSIMNDERTTIMIRNIPNRYTINDLSSEIDEFFENTYDFLYLPCDFNNQCNVGYGFINFLSTSFLLSFYERFHNQMWKKFRSQKICALTYARLQGLNQLIDHFANSKVLNQKEKKYRPIIKYDKIQEIVLAQQKK